MKILFWTIIFVVFSFQSIAQIKFEQGYFVKNDLDTIKCLIKNLDWKDNPKFFKYKFSDTSEVKTASIDSVMEFGIQETVKYKRFDVEIDRSSEQVNLLSLDKALYL